MPSSDKRKWVVGAVVAALAIAVVQPPSADLRILTHDAADRDPRKVEAAIDLGIAAFSLIVTWTQRAAR